MINKKTLVLLLSMVLSFTMYSETSTRDSLLNRQIQAITKSYRETRQLTFQLDSLRRELRNNLYRDSVYSSLEIQRLENVIELNSEKLSSELKSSKEKKNSTTDWIRAVVAILGIPVAIWGIVKLFIKDKATERKLNSLEEVSVSQARINENMDEQLKELKIQTDEFKKQSLFMIDRNKMTEESLRIESEKHEYERQKKYVELEEYFIQVLMSIQEPLEKQAVNYERFGSELMEDRVHDFRLEIVTAIRIENIEVIDSTDLYKIFVSKRKGIVEEKIQLYNELQNSINYIRLVKSKEEGKFEKLLERYRTHEKDWQDAIVAIHRFYDEALMQANRDNITRTDDPFFEAWHQVIQSWSEQRNNPAIDNIRDPYFMIDSYVKPLLQLCNRHKDDIRCDKLVPVLTRCLSAQKNMDHVRKLHGASYLRKAEKMRENTELLYNSLDKLKEIEKV